MLTLFICKLQNLQQCNLACDNSASDSFEMRREKCDWMSVFKRQFLVPELCIVCPTPHFESKALYCHRSRMSSIRCPKPILMVNCEII